MWVWLVVIPVSCCDEVFVLAARHFRDILDDIHGDDFPFAEDGCDRQADADIAVLDVGC